MLSCETTDPVERRARPTNSSIGNRSSHLINRSLPAQVHFTNVIDAMNGKRVLAKTDPNTHNRDGAPLERVMKNPLPSSRTTTWPSYRALQTVRGREGPFIR